MVDRSDETPIPICTRSMEEIAWYLAAMQSHWSKEKGEIASDATRALVEWKRGNYKPAQNFLIGWYNTIRKVTGIEKLSDEDLTTYFSMEEVINGKNNRQHLALLAQMFVTLEPQ